MEDTLGRRPGQGTEARVPEHQRRRIVFFNKRSSTACVERKREVLREAPQAPKIIFDRGHFDSEYEGVEDRGQGFFSLALMWRLPSLWLIRRHMFIFLDIISPRACRCTTGLVRGRQNKRTTIAFRRQLCALENVMCCGGNDVRKLLSVVCPLPLRRHIRSLIVGLTTILTIIIHIFSRLVSRELCSRVGAKGASRFKFANGHRECLGFGCEMCAAPS